MVTLSIISAAILAIYLVVMAIRHGLPPMISYTYYQLGKNGWLFSLVLVATAAVMLPAVLDAELGIQCLAFIACIGLAFVGCAPNYLSADDETTHKTAAITAAAGAIGWSLSVDCLPTIGIVSLYMLYVAYIGLATEKATKPVAIRPLFWAELAAIADLFATYWLNV